MGSRKKTGGQQRKQSREPITDLPPGTFLPEDDSDELTAEEDAELTRLTNEFVREMAVEEPVMFEDMVKSIQAWRDHFVSEQGREPVEEDLLAVWEEVAADPELLAELDAELAEEAFWEPDEGEGGVPACLAECAWCGRSVEGDDEVFGIGVKLAVPVVGQSGSAGVVHLPLPSEERMVAAVPARGGSEAQRDGWDLTVMVCSEQCARELEEALQRETQIAIACRTN